MQKKQRGRQAAQLRHRAGYLHKLAADIEAIADELDAPEPDNPEIGAGDRRGGAVDGPAAPGVQED